MNPLHSISENKRSLRCVGYGTLSTTQMIQDHHSPRLVLGEVRRLAEEHKDEEIGITVVGHSLGGVMATLNAVDIAANELNNPRDRQNKACPVTAFVFGSPRIGDSSFKEVFSGLKNVRVLRVRNTLDVVSVRINTPTNLSVYLKSLGNLQSWHNLEAYLHGVAGTQGSKGGFELEIKHDIALVNKQLDALNDDNFIPPSWWCENNKGMVQQPDGSWKLMDHESNDNF
ncbi:hypothetical protein HYC85_018589 [Camellia sinensis]|uniref:Phospholipase A1 n=1 Tax=Camellia sinensis TaxID=4442 RepID=A0A7J7GUQ2_CAMSI|nr:hypothetical protein HYC85_018589 [Camellia sinensis]